MMKFMVGDVVEILSIGHGTKITRRGVVTEVVPEEHAPKEINLPRHIGGARGYESYVVFTSTKNTPLAKLVGGKFNKETDRYFWPRAGNLTLVRRARKS